MKDFWKTPVFAWIAPYVAFGLLGLLAGLGPTAPYWVYPVKTLAVAMLILWVWKRLELRRPRNLLLSVVTGVVVLALWIVPYGWLTPESARSGGFNPFEQFAPAVAWALIAVRIAGAALVVPVMEEAFTRGFLQRFLVSEDFSRVPHGVYTHISFWGTAGFFALAHGGEWAVALIAAVAYGALYCQTKSLSDVMVAHGVTNLLLGLYVVYSQKWYFW
ncbi:CAAX prenyl protease-related protein [Kamptonema cortianum]|nr:CAAX prenyl protease-related protein [Oscillatoria laete-virens]MDK3157165.1 CAAX prenyl protease-related protein [Kamptonema cortianum]MDL5051141.1 CAAX prenyl protease-related protein [Oscillatoria amoena NRMC-F 0135]MDL5055047.1 CAAX prenyl protease-related protein [Oscillatoria laete-virens NRMC-F 0139]